MRSRKKEPPKTVFPIAPMIDCVFLMLVYFMVSATLKPQEADITFQLPGVAEQSDPLEMPDEQIIEIDESGQVLVNDYPYDTPASESFTALAAMLFRYKQVSDASKTDAVVTISPASNVVHQTIVKVMDACALAKISHVSFALDDEEPF